MTIPGIPNPAVPYGSCVVVTGVTGFIGSHVADQLLTAGYRVCGTTRDLQKGMWAQTLFQSKFGADNFELKQVTDMATEGAFNEIVIGRQVDISVKQESLADSLLGKGGFIHVANDMSKSRDTDAAVQVAVNGALNALRASAAAGVKRFVYTSSSFAATQPKLGKIFTITNESYNDEAVERASKPDPDGETVYSASKVAAEKAIWSWVKENNPSMVVNTGSHDHRLCNEVLS